MMTYKSALFFNVSSEYTIASALANSMSFSDPEMKKIRDQIKDHERAIRKLGIRLEECKAKMAKNMLPAAIKKKEEARRIVELHKQVEREFDRKLNESKAL